MQNVLLKIKNKARSLKKTRSYFEMERKSYFRSHPIYNIPEDATPELKEFLTGGAVVLPNFHSMDVIEALQKAALSLAQDLRREGESKYPESIIYADDGIYRLRNIEKYIPGFLPILENSTIQELVSAYGGRNILAEKNYLDYKPDVGKHDETTAPHMDQWLTSVKVFTLLTDVTPDQAPFVYWRKSHLDWPWRRNFDYDNWTGSETGSAGICPPSILAARCSPKGSLEKITVTGKAGTVIIADTRTFHRASNLYQGCRLQIVQKFPATYPKRFKDVILGK